MWSGAGVDGGEFVEVVSNEGRQRMRIVGCWLVGGWRESEWGGSSGKFK